MALGRSDFAPAGRNYLNAIQSTKVPRLRPRFRTANLGCAEDDEGIEAFGIAQAMPSPVIHRLNVGRRGPSFAALKRCAGHRRHML